MKKESKPASNDPRANHQTRKPPRGCPKTGRDRPTRSCAL